MPYNSTLLNRLAQFGSVSYDLVLTDSSGIMPTIRNSLSIPVGGDTPANRSNIIRDCVARAVEEFNTPPPPVPIETLPVILLTGAEEPPDAVGTENDIYLDVASGDVWLKRNGNWR